MGSGRPRSARLFRLPPGDPPTSSMFIILMVITAASTMQSVGGIDYLVNVARAILKKNPAYITLIAPLVAFVFTLGGDGIHLLSPDRSSMPSPMPTAFGLSVR